MTALHDVQALSSALLELRALWRNGEITDSEYHARMTALVLTHSSED